MSVTCELIKRNCKLYFKDKGMFFSSMITPVILLVLYITFLAKVYRDIFMSGMPSVEATISLFCLMTELNPSVIRPAAEMRKEMSLQLPAGMRR